MSKAYNLFIKDSEIHDFKAVLEVSKGSFADTIMVVNSTIKNCEQGFLLNKEKNDGGDYNAEFVIIKNTIFNGISGTILDYYRGGYDESTIGGFLTIKNNKFTTCGKAEKTGILIKTKGIINVNIVENTFINNPIKLIAVLWGEKNNHHKNNILKNSGKIKVEEQQKLKILY